jgi:hypothetical protein
MQVVIRSGARSGAVDEEICRNSSVLCSFIRDPNDQLAEVPSFEKSDEVMRSMLQANDDTLPSSSLCH